MPKYYLTKLLPVINVVNSGLLWSQDYYYHCFIMIKKVDIHTKRLSETYGMHAICVKINKIAWFAIVK